MANYAPDDEISGYAGLARRSPIMAMGLTAALLSLAGIPPFVGFFAKLYLFLAAIQANSLGLAVAGDLGADHVGRLAVLLRARDAHHVDAPGAADAQPIAVGYSFSQGLALTASVAGVRRSSAS